jgi:hypothetical protein
VVQQRCRKTFLPFPEIGNRMDKQVFKFTNSKYADSVLGGRIMVRPLSYYRNLEAQGAPPGIGDRLEFRSETFVDYLSDSHFPLHKNIGPIGMIPAISPMPGARNWSIRNVTLSYGVQLDPWVFCASHGDLTELSKTMCRKIGPGDPYDACIRILDFARFAKRLFQLGRVQELRSCRVSDAFGNLSEGEIQYVAVRTTIQDGPPPQPHPLRKDISFGAQRESRLVLWPKREIVGDCLFIDAPSLGRLMVREF